MELSLRELVGAAGVAGSGGLLAGACFEPRERRQRRRLLSVLPLGDQGCTRGVRGMLWGFPVRP